MAEIARETYVVRSEGISVDLIIWQRFHQPRPGLLERILALDENQHLERADFELPLGTTVTIPIDKEPTAETQEVISLWD